MKFKDKYPEAKPKVPGYQENYINDEIQFLDTVYSGRHFQCFICRDITPFVSLDETIHLCSEECSFIAVKNEPNLPHAPGEEPKDVANY